jgi:urease subunit alpha
MFASLGGAVGPVCYSFVSQSSLDAGIVQQYGLNKRAMPVRNCRNLGKKDMKLNSATPVITVDPETYQVTADGQPLVCAPAESVPLSQRYCLF